MKSVLIVGAGFSGSLVAIHLLREDAELRVILIEKRGRFGLGVAYSTNIDAHLLNVPAGKMSAFAAEPDHFLDWLRAPDHGAMPDAGPESFVSRRLYGKYLQHALEQAAILHRNRLSLISGEAVGLRETDGRAIVALADGRQIEADRVVLALGNFPPSDPKVENQDFYSSPYYRSDPWQPNAIENFATDADVLLIGSGLTTVDVVISLLEQGHTGKIHSISRHGLNPRRHAESVALKPPELGSRTITARGLLSWVRNQIDKAQNEAAGWRSIVDSFRPITQELWRAASPQERRRFYRHLRPWWDVHRHRVPPAVADRIGHAVQAGQLVFHTGRIQGYEYRGGSVTIKFRSAAHESSIEVAGVINCTGPASDYQKIGDSLVMQLVREGIVRPDPLRLGLDVDRDLRVISNDGKPSKLVYAVGPPTKGALWEINAVPDLRMQTKTLASHIASELSIETAAGDAPTS